MGFQKRTTLPAALTLSALCASGFASAPHALQASGGAPQKPAAGPPAAGTPAAGTPAAGTPAQQATAAASSAGAAHAAPPAGSSDAAANRRSAYEAFLEGQRLEGQGDFVRAVDAYKRSIDLAPNEDEPRAALAQLYLANRNAAAAEQTALDAIKVNKTSVPAHSVLAQIYVTEAIIGGSVDKAKSQRATDELEQLAKIDEKANVELGSRSIRALALLGELYKSTDQQDKAIAAFERLSRVESTSPDAFLSLASLYADADKYREAVRAAEQARKIDPSNLQASVILAQAYLRTGRTAEALDVYKQALATAEDSQTRDALRLEYADALMRTGKYAEAIDAVKPIITTDPKNVRAVKIVADANRRGGHRDLAAKALEDALVGQDVSESLDLVYALAETYEETGQFDKAVSTYEEALSALTNPDGTVAQKDRQNAAVVLRRIALAHRLAGRPAKVTETFERMRKALGPNDPLPDLNEIQNAMDTADYDTAVTLARKGGARFTGDDKRSFVFAEAQALGKKGDLPSAVKLLDGQLAKTPQDVDVYAVLAVVQLDAGDAASAEKSVRKALEIEPNDPGLLITLSSVQDKAKQYAASEQSLRQVLKADPDNATALNNLGYFLTERKERLDEALAFIQRAVNIEPTNGSYLDSLGWLYFQMGKTAEAKQYLEQAATYEHRSSAIREHLGDLYAKLGDAAKAREHYQAALRLANEPDEIARIKGKLK